MPEIDELSDHPIWSNATHAWTSSDGSAGVLFVNVRPPREDSEDRGLACGDMVYVIKGASRVAEEIYATRLARAVGISVPHCRLVQYTSSEWLMIKNELIRITENVNTSTDPRIVKVRMKLSTGLGRAFFLVMDYVDGAVMECNYTVGTHLESATAFTENIGKIISFDIFINNGDRIPVVHSNDGNAHNIIVQASGNCVAIDTCITSIHPINASSLYEVYSNRVERFLDAIFSEDTRRVVVALEPVREFLYSATAYKVQDQQLLDIANSIRKAITDIARNITAEQLVDLKAEVEAMVTVDWEGVWGKSIELINIEFLVGMLTLFRKFDTGFK